MTHFQIDGDRCANSGSFVGVTAQSPDETFACLLANFYGGSNANYSTAASYCPL